MGFCVKDAPQHMPLQCISALRIIAPLFADRIITSTRRRWAQTSERLQPGCKEAVIFCHPPNPVHNARRLALSCLILALTMDGKRHPSSFQQLEKLGEGTYATVSLPALPHCRTAVRIRPLL